MSSSTSTTVGNVVVVTHVHPAPPEEHTALGCTQRFRRGHPQALGSVQIMIGALTLIFGIAMACYGPTLAVISGIFVWGALTYIAAGSLTVAAEKSPTRCLINASLALNVIAAVFSFIAFILFLLDTFIWLGPYYQFRFQGFSAVVAIFQLLEFVVTTTMAGFTCDALCHCCTSRPVVVTTVEGSMPAQAPPTFQPVNVAPAQYQHPPQGALYYKNTVDQPGPAVPPAYEAST